MEFSKHGSGTTSVVVHHAPGGSSQIQIGGGYGTDKKDKEVSGKIGAPAATVPKAVPKEEEKKEEPAKGIAGGAPEAKPAGGSVTTSVKVHQPPGGKSTALW
jgi:hypothetical protein